MERLGRKIPISRSQEFLNKFFSFRKDRPRQEEDEEDEDEDLGVPGRAVGRTRWGTRKAWRS